MATKVFPVLAIMPVLTVSGNVQHWANVGLMAAQYWPDAVFAGHVDCDKQSALVDYSSSIKGNILPALAIRVMLPLFVVMTGIISVLASRHLLSTLSCDDYNI